MAPLFMCSFGSPLCSRTGARRREVPGASDRTIPTQVSDTRSGVSETWALRTTTSSMSSGALRPSSCSRSAICSTIRRSTNPKPATSTGDCSARTTRASPPSPSTVCTSPYWRPTPQVARCVRDRASHRNALLRPEPAGQVGEASVAAGRAAGAAVIHDQRGIRVGRGLGPAAIPLLADRNIDDEIGDL